jgi:hypothetical protein
MMMTAAKRTLFDVLWGAIILAWIILLIVPATRGQYLKVDDAHAYLVGFFNFAILATMGDLLAGRISSGDWTINVATIFRLIVWGIIGMAITLFFGIMANGVAAVQGSLLPFKGSTFAHALLTSILINISFGPAMFIFHKFTDTYIDAKYYKKPSDMKSMIERIDWKTFFKFTVFTMVPCFWIPCHTIVFLLPANIRVLLAAFLSIALGLLLSIKKRAAIKK